MKKYGLGPCREIGQIKEGIKEAILEGDIPNERGAALQKMDELANELGLV